MGLALRLMFFLPSLVRGRVEDQTDDALTRRGCHGGGVGGAFYATSERRPGFGFHEPVRPWAKRDAKWDAKTYSPKPAVRLVEDRSYAPYYVPAPTCPLQQRTATPTPQAAPERAWYKYSPSYYWADPAEPLLDPNDQQRCAAALRSMELPAVHLGGDTAKRVDQLVNKRKRSSPDLWGLAAQCYQYWRYMPSMSQLTSLHGLGYSNFGQTILSAGVLFSGSDREFLDFVLMARPEAMNMVEFGTASGITSVYLGTAAGMRGGKLTTIDIRDVRSPQAKAVWNDRYMHRIYGDLLAQVGSECRAFSCVAVNGSIVEAVSSAHVWLVDNGRKDKEVFLYARHAPLGCIALVHDMVQDRTQYNLFDAPFRLHGYEPLFTELAMSMGSHLRAWVRVAHKAPPDVAAKLKEPGQVHHSSRGYEA